MVTFANLETRVKNWAENDGTEFDTEFDTMLETAEYRISRELNADAMVLHKTSTFTSGSPYLDKPSDAVDIHNFSFIDTGDNSEIKFLEYRDLTYIQDYSPVRTTTGTPLFYSNWDEDSLYIGPTPSSAFANELEYEARIKGLSASVTTTWLSLNHPDLLFNCILLEAGAFEKNSDMEAKFEKRYTRDLVTAQAEVARIRGDHTSIHRNPTETPVDDDDGAE
jgi:hypothetical protein